MVERYLRWEFGGEKKALD
uniref:Uncharacterized protein n=1 Tax=Arundo donax TaxID=35708 RepID=A0A0A9GLU4_ARUDO